MIEVVTQSTCDPARGLLEQARQGDHTAFTRLIDPFLERGFRLALAMLHDSAEAEDVVQEAVLGAWRKLEQNQSEAAFGPWFLAIVANRCRTVRRSRWFQFLRVADPAREHAAPMGGRDLDLERALQRLEPGVRAAILLHFYLDLPIVEVAAVLGLTVAGVKGRINRGLKRLRPLVDSTEAMV